MYFGKMLSKMHLISQMKNEQMKIYLLFPLAFLVLLSLLLSVISVYHLHWEDHVPIKTGTLLFLYGIVFFTCLYQFLNGIFLHTNSGRNIMKTYRLTVGDVLDISNKEVSAVQALFCCITGLTCCLYSCSRNILRTSHYISEAYAWFGAAYFFYDVWSMYRVYCCNIANVHMNGDSNFKENEVKVFFRYLKSNGVIVGHHVFIGCFGFLVITYLRGGLGDCFFGFVYLMEASTPFVSARGILSKIGMKSSNLYVINGLIMVATFFICRVAMFPYVIYIYAQSVHLDYISAIYSLPRGCLISILILLLPQIYWFQLMLKGATQVLRKKVISIGATSKKNTETTQ